MRWLMDAMATVASETYTSVSAPIQYAAVAAFEGNTDIEDYLQRSRRVLGALGVHCAQQLRDAGAHCDDPEGAFYLFPDFDNARAALATRGIRDPETLCAGLLENTGVATLPGTDFGCPASDLTIRLAYVDFDGAAALTAAGPEVTLDLAWITQHCPRVIDGIERIADWINPG
jgi:aspartate aminotransferase